MKQTNLKTIGLIGAGNIGSGVIEILGERIKKVAVKDKDKHDIPLPLTDDYKEIIEDSDIDTVIELVGGYEPARTMILEAIAARKNIVTANKAVLARHGEEIFKAAKENGVNVNFEAAVGAAIPIIRTIRESLVSDDITSIYGILNGTTNYILCKMEEGMSYEDALKKAQELGFAEPDPTFDVEGMDAAQKIVILARLAFKVKVDEDIDVFGITKLSQPDIEYAKEMGYKVKLLAIAKKAEKLEIRTQPVMISNEHALAAVNDEMNAVYLISENSGESMLYGKGAGKMPTATVVVSDALDKSKKTIPDVKDIDIEGDISSRFYLRLMLTDKPGVLASFTKVLGNNNISINAVQQKEQDKDVVPVVVITHKAKERDIKKAIKEIKGLDAVKDDPVYLRIEDL